MGLRKRFEFEREGQKFGFYVELGEGSYIEFFEGAEEGEPGRQRIRHLAIEIDDIGALEKRLQEGGVTPRNKKLGADGSWQMWCDDPNGVPIEFQQYTEESSQRTGRKVVL